MRTLLTLGAAAIACAAFLPSATNAYAYAPGVRKTFAYAPRHRK